MRLSCLLRSVTNVSVTNDVVNVPDSPFIQSKELKGRKEKLVIKIKISTMKTIKLFGLGRKCFYVTSSDIKDYLQKLLMPNFETITSSKYSIVIYCILRSVFMCTSQFHNAFEFSHSFKMKRKIKQLCRLKVLFLQFTCC